MLDSNIVKTYINAMELLVEEELRQQIAALPQQKQKISYMNQMELIAYALNQLPSLYATGEKGLTYQLAQGRKKYSGQIHQAVRRSIMAVQRDPLLSYVPLQAQPPAGIREVLYQLQVLLKVDRLDWVMLPQAVEQALFQAARSTPAWRHVPRPRSFGVYVPEAQVATTPIRPSLPPPQTSIGATSTAWDDTMPDTGWDAPFSKH